MTRETINVRPGSVGKICRTDIYPAAVLADAPQPNLAPVRNRDHLRRLTSATRTHLGIYRNVLDASVDVRAREHLLPAARVLQSKTNPLRSRQPGKLDVPVTNDEMGVGDGDPVVVRLDYLDAQRIGPRGSCKNNRVDGTNAEERGEAYRWCRRQGQRRCETTCSGRLTSCGRGAGRGRRPWSGRGPASTGLAGPASCGCSCPTGRLGAPAKSFSSGLIPMLHNNCDSSCFKNFPGKMLTVEN